jgi:hypothetical protein
LKSALSHVRSGISSILMPGLSVRNAAISLSLTVKLFGDRKWEYANIMAASLGTAGKRA